ncbi:MAG: PAS domain S-box protein [Burkholderiales bacterium]|nr:PAS domain S-box protein [Burkholderiales bacterium]
MLVAVLPLAVFGFGVAWMMVGQTEAVQTDKLAGTARALQVAVDRVLDSQIAAIGLLATDVSLDDGDMAAFQERARRAVAAQPLWRNAVLIDPQSHRMLVSVKPLPGPATTSSEPEEVDAVARSGRPAVGSVLARGKVVREPLVLFLAPVIRNGQVRYVITVGVTTQALNSIFADQHLPASWTGAILDDHLHLAGRSHDAERFVGKPATPSLARHIEASASGMFNARTQEGLEVDTVFSRSPGSGWTVAIGVPHAEVLAPIHAAFVRLALAGAALMVLALGATAFFGRVIVRRRNAYERALHEDIVERMRIERALRASEQRFRNFSDSSADWFWETDAALRFSFLSQNFAEVVGIDPAAVLGSRRAELLARLPPDAAPGAAEHLAALEQRLPFRDFEYRTVDDRGETRWVSVSGLPYEDEDGRFAGYRGVGQDITARKAAEEAVDRGNRLLRESIERIATGFTIFDEHDRLVICNEAYRDIYATSRDLIVPGASFEEIVRRGAERGQYRGARGDLEAWVRARVAQHQKADGAAREQLLDDGRWVLIVENRTPGGYIVGNRIDITGLKKAQEEVRKLSLAIEQSPASVIVTDLAGRIEYVNHGFVATTGYTSEEVLGRNPSLLQSGLTPRASYEAMWQALARRQAWRGEFHNRRRDGSIYIELAVITPVQQADGSVTHYVSVQEDITERIRLGEELARHRNRLEEQVISRTAQLAEARDAAESANVAKTAFLANMSHEIRTPLNAITGMAYLIRRAGVSPEQSARLDKIETAGRHLLEIIDAVLDLSKIEVGKFSLDESEVNLAGIAANVVSMMSERAQAKHLPLSVEIEPQARRLLGDPTRLQQALLNYASNAIKFTQQGRVVLRAAVVEEDEAGVLVRFEVEDTGIGIAEDEARRLFNAFEQADNSITRRFGGTGLGLAITLKLAHLMGGDAGVHSRLGAGSTFWFTARLRKAGPRLENTAPAPESAEHRLRSVHAGARILLAEDEPVNQEVTTELLRDVGLEVDLANDGLEAVEKAASGRYDLVLMDLQMPRLDGLEATRRIRARDPGVRLPILAMTANAFVEDKARCHEAGMDDFISKPVDADNLFETLASWLDRKTAAAAPG